MAIDIQYNKVPVFTDVNDNEIAPTSTSAGNGSHLISKHNDLVDEVEVNINDVLSSIDDVISSSLKNWVVAIDNYSAQPGEKIVMNINNDSIVRPSYDLRLPSNPPIGTAITYVGTTVAKTINITNFNIVNSASYYTRLYTDDAFVIRTLVYLGSSKGWSTVTGMNYKTTVQAN
jgi:hypothetical protein